jgi:hypothetical protein
VQQGAAGLRGGQEPASKMINAHLLIMHTACEQLIIKLRSLLHEKLIKGRPALP